MNKLLKISMYISGLITLAILAIAVLLASDFMVMLFILMLIITIFVGIAWMIVDLYYMDKELDYEQLRKSKLTVVPCTSCLKENVLEDQYCVYCGEKLEG